MKEMSNDLNLLDCVTSVVVLSLVNGNNAIPINSFISLYIKMLIVSMPN